MFVRGGRGGCSGGAADLPRLSHVFELAAPNALGLYKGQVYRTNRYGFRGPEPCSRKALRTFRIVVIGDWTTMGEGVSEEETDGAPLERMLASRGSGRFEAIDPGISGANLRQSLEGWKRARPASDSARPEAG